MKYRIVGAVDLVEGNVGRMILKVPILGTVDRLHEILGQLEQNGQRPELIVLTTKLRGQPLRDLQQICQRSKAALCQFPKILDFENGTSATAALDLSPIVIEKLLARPQVKLEEKTINAHLEGRRVLVTGAGGSIGSELCRQIASHQPAELILLDFGEYSLYAIDMEMRAKFPDVQLTAALVNIRDRTSLDHVFRRRTPELVFHAAALKHVPLVELHPIQGVLTNVLGTRNVAEAARDNGALAFVQVSTDKAVGPTNVMGATKRFAEFYIQALDVAASEKPAGCSTLFKTVRFGNVIGSSGSVLPLFQKQISAGGPVTVTDPRVTRYFMTIREASELVLHASTAGMRRQHHAAGEIFVLDMGPPVRIIDIAKQMISLAERDDVPIEIIGLRPGEKLYEDLFDSDEQQTFSSIPGILMACSKPMEMARLNKACEEFEDACRAGDEAAAIRTLAQNVPGYTPSKTVLTAAAVRSGTGRTISHRHQDQVSAITATSKMGKYGIAPMAFGFGEAGR